MLQKSVADPRGQEASSQDWHSVERRSRVKPETPKDGRPPSGDFVRTLDFATRKDGNVANRALKMHLPLRWAVCLFAGALTLVGQPATESATNVSCFERINVPDYPALARPARIAADVKVSVVIGRDSASHQITTQVVPQGLRGFFSERVEKAVRSSTFNHQCVAKTIELVFSFELGDDMPVEGSKQTISFSYPNRFIIASTAVIVQP